MIEPVASSVQRCPFCHQTIRGTAETCLHCGAERQFGPSLRESLTSAAIGLVAAPAGTLLVGAGTTVALIAAAIGGIMGFYVAHARHAGDRWVAPKPH